MNRNIILKGTIHWFLFTVFSLAVFVVQGQGVGKKLADVVQSYVDKGEFSGSILVAKKGKVLLKAAYGYSDRENKVKNEVDTKYLIGSTTKSFTAVAVMQMVEQGLVDLHTPIERYIPFVRPDIGHLTLHQLLKMTSGLPGHLARITDLKYEDITARQMIDLINRAELSFEPGARYEYSNLNYQLAACIFAEISEMNYGEILRKCTFDPLGMEHSGNETTHQVPSKKALGYYRLEDGTLVRANRNYMSYALGSGDVYSTVEDLFKWDRALRSNAYLTSEYRALLFDGDPDEFGGYGYGFKVAAYQRAIGKGQGKLVRHGGSMQGYYANFHRYLDDDITIIILANMRPFPIIDLTFDLKEVVLGREAGRVGKEYRY